MFRRHLPLPTLLTLVLASFPLAHALDAAALAPALEARFPASVSYLDCPYAHEARSCVLLPGASSAKAGYALLRSFLHTLPATAKVDPAQTARGLSFQLGETDYELTVAPSKARPGLLAATLSFVFDPAFSYHAVCLKRDALFDYAGLSSLSVAEYNAITTAATCHGPDPVDAQNWTPLVVAVNSRNLAAVKALLRSGADPNHITMSGWTPLLFAAKSGTRPVLDALLQAGADPSYIAPDGATVVALEPFNPHLGAPAAPASELAVLPDPLSPVDLGEIASDDRTAQAAPASATAIPASAGVTAPGPATVGDAAAASTAPSRGGSTAPAMTLELVAVVALLILVLVRARRAEARLSAGARPAAAPRADPLVLERPAHGPPTPVEPVIAQPSAARPTIVRSAGGPTTAAGPSTRAAPVADLPAMPVPDPFQRPDRTSRQLDDAPPGADPPV